MSTAIRCFLVDWNRFTEALAKSGNLREALRGSNEVAQCVAAQDSLLKAAQAMRDAYPGSSAESLHELFRHLFWPYCSWEYRIVEVSPVPADFLEIAWSVATTRRFADVAEHVCLEDCRVLFEKDNPHRYRTLFFDFSEFEPEAALWIETVKKAGSQGLGLVFAQDSGGV